MQIQRIKTLNEIDGTGSNVITKDYFESNPVFYYCYRIFPFERGHGIFVANSIRRFLLYEIPTIAITSVLIRTVKENSEKTKISEEQGAQPSALPSELQNQPANEVRPDAFEPGAAQVVLPTQLTTPPGGKAPLPKSSAAQLKKKKVTKKALKEQAAELFSYTSDPFAQPLDIPTNHDGNLMNPNGEPNNQQSDQEVSSLTEFTTIPFVRESFLEILLNLKACVFENTFAFDESGSERASEVLKGKLILNATQESVDDFTEVSQELFFQTDFQSKDQQFVKSSTDEGTVLPSQGQTSLTRTTVVSSPAEWSHHESRSGWLGDQGEKKVFPQGRRVREYKIWAKDLILPPGLKVKNPDLVLATLVAPKTNCELELSFEKIFQPDLTTLSMKTGRAPHRAEHQRRNVPIDGTLFPIKKVNFALSYTKFQKEVVTFEIWTNGSLNPRAAIFQCVEKILTLFQNLRESQVKEIDSFDETSPDEFETTS